MNQKQIKSCERKYIISYHANVHVDLMEETVIQINAGITINVNLNVKDSKYVKKIMFGILLHVIAENI